MVVYNNDIFNFLVLFPLLPFYSFYTSHYRTFFIFCFLFVCFIHADIDYLRIFQTEFIEKEIVLNKIFVHDTRRVTSYISWEDLSIENYHTGDVYIYVTSESDEIFFLSDHLYPKFMASFNKGDLICVGLEKFVKFSKYYTINSLCSN